jgi:glucose/arabinose dehydrogenase
MARGTYWGLAAVRRAKTRRRTSLRIGGKVHVNRLRRWLAAASMITLGIGGLAVPAVISTASAAVPVLPAGFALESTPTGQAANLLTGFVELPTGGAITIGKCGKVTFVPVAAPPRQLATVPASCAQDLGLVGVALPPDFSTSRRVYTLYSYLGSDGVRYARLSYWLLDNVTQPTTMTSEQVIPLGQVAEDGQGLSHGPGTVLFAPDGTIYLGLGDSASFFVVDAKSNRAQDPASPYGKIFHIDTAGNGVPGNPYYDPANPASWRSRVFAMGMRNPFRFTIHSATGRLFLGDVGWNSWEEQDVAVPGSNFGWPCWEGTGHTAGYDTTSFCTSQYAANTRHDNPLYTYPHNGAGAAAVGGIFTGTNSSYPAAYRGAYFAGDYAQGKITVLRPDNNDQLTAPVETFGSNIGAPVDFQLDPASGDVVYADIVSGNLVRIKYAAGNRAPFAVATQDASRSNPDQLIVAFDASGSYDLDGDPMTYSWNFGDGQSGTGIAPAHKYASAAKITVTLTVSDGRATGTATLKVSPSNHPPKLTVTMSPPASHLFAVGEPIQLSATATDAEDGDLTSKITWQEILLHCPFGGPCHIHPGITGSGATFNDTFTDHGGDTSMVFTASVTDGAGTSVNVDTTAKPDVHTLSVTSPYPVNIDGFVTSTWTAVAGEQVTVTAPAGSLSASFTGWSDGNTNLTRTITMPRTDVALTAKYNDAVDSKYAALGGPSSVLGNPTGNELAIAGGSWRMYQRGAIYWSSATGAHEVHGAIGARYVSVGGPASWGFPTTDESAAPNGRYNEFQRLIIGWTSAYGAHTVANGDLIEYRKIGGPLSYGIPYIDEHRTPDTRGSYQHFTPVSSVGRSIYYYPGIGSHEVHGAIRATWSSLGWERSRLGYPITDEFSVSGGRRSTFQHGYIFWNATTGKTAVIYS